ncbi:MAG: ExbD/TolR family protein [Planctomycetaceae bacterium]
MPLKTHQDDMPSINLTPMIDIVFQLIIFFMVGSRFTEMEKKVDLSVPEVSTKAELPTAPEKFVVNVYRDGKLTLNEQPVTREQLIAQLSDAKRSNPDISVTVRGDGASPLQEVANALTACKQAGIADMGISVRVAKENTGTKSR